MSTPILSDLDFSSGTRIVSLPPAIAPGQPATFEQLGGGGSIPVESVDLNLIGQTQSHEEAIARPGTLPTQNIRAWLASSVDNELWQLERVTIDAECQTDSIVFCLDSMYFESGIIKVNYQVF